MDEKPEDLAPRLDDFLREWMPSREIQTSTVARRVLLRRSPQSQPIADPGTF